MTLCEEFMLLKDFEKREDLLANKMLVKVQEKDDIEDKVWITKTTFSFIVIIEMPKKNLL